VIKDFLRWWLGVPKDSGLDQPRGASRNYPSVAAAKGEFWCRQVENGWVVTRQEFDQSTHTVDEKTWISSTDELSDTIKAAAVTAKLTR
jgi:hypothetical protein